MTGTFTSIRTILLILSVVGGSWAFIPQTLNNSLSVSSSVSSEESSVDIIHHDHRCHTSLSSTTKDDPCWKSFDPKELGVGGTYGLGVSAIVPRPVAVITTLSSLPPPTSGINDQEDDLTSLYDKNGIIVNCAPFSYTGLLSHEPPMVCHGICMTSKGKKDTLINIEKNKEWVFNVMSLSWVEQANSCSVECDSNTSEVDVAGLHILPGETGSTPRLQEAMVSMECQLDSIKEVYNDDGKHTTSIVFGRIVRYHIHTSVLAGDVDANKPTIDLEKMQFVGRAGGNTYFPAGEGKTISLKRP